MLCPIGYCSSLAELLTSMLVFGLVAIVVTTAMIMTLRTSRATSTRANSLGDAQVALDAMSKVIQTAAQPPAIEGATAAAALITATTTDLKFYAYNSPGSPPAQVEFRVTDAGELVETVTRSTNSGPSACLPPYHYGSGSTRVLARGISSGTQIFSYFGKPTTSNMNGSALTLAGTPPRLATSDLGNVELVGIDLTVDPDSHPSVAATHATITVSLPNHLVAAANLPDSAC